MNREYVLGTIANLMKWNDDEARREFAWLRLMSRMKYDDYQEFLAGMRFVESLADWLQQFEPEERRVAYDFVRNHLVFVSEEEMRHLAALLYPVVVEPILMGKAAEATGVPRFSVWSDAGASQAYDRLLRQTVFVELSDGARGDVFRRANAGRVSNEQIVNAPRPRRDKWNEMLDDLREDLGDEEARFESVVLVDDFAGSGKSLLRRDGGRWKGKLQRVWEALSHPDDGILDSHLTTDFTTIVHHYLATTQARHAIDEAFGERHRDKSAGSWFSDVQFTYGMVLPPSLRLDASAVGEFSKLVERYYDDSIETKHTRIGGGDVRWGFGSCGLPLVFEHNAPNNGIALLWAESSGERGNPAMRPLFRRRQRHS